MVIAIIAILAAVLFPVFAQAKLAAKKTADLSNMKQIGTATQIYLGDSDDVYAQAYWYKNNAGDVNGYVHWTGSHYPYFKSLDMLVSPGDPSKGLPPTNAPCRSIGDFSMPGDPAPCVAQAPKLSCTVNAALMPRLRHGGDPANVVSTTAVDSVADTILVAPFSNTAGCVNDTSQGQQDPSYKNESHRPTNAVMTGKSGGKWAGDSIADRDVPAVYAVTAAVAKEAWNYCKTNNSSDRVHLQYIEGSRFGNGSNYSFADGHAKFFAPEATLNPDRFMWGKSM